MGERRDDGGVPGRRRVHPGGTTSARPERPGEDQPLPGAVLEARLGTVIRGGDPEGAGSEAERVAVAAFRAARDSGAHRAARTRRRDDWRPREARRARLSLRATLSVLLASLTLGGAVAVASVGSFGSAPHGGRPSERVGHPSAGAPRQPAAPRDGTAPGTSSARPGHPATAADTLAHCRAYEQVHKDGKALDATAWRRLVRAAGGEGEVTTYCAAELARADARNPHRSADQGKSGAAPGKGGKGSRNGSGRSSGGNGATGDSGAKGNDSPASHAKN
ncbi:hypothetical protein ACWDFL_00010 [Streptomyces bungoensis]